MLVKYGLLSYVLVKELCHSLVHNLRTLLQQWGSISPLLEIKLLYALVFVHSKSFFRLLEDKWLVLYSLGLTFVQQSKHSSNISSNWFEIWWFFSSDVPIFPFLTVNCLIFVDAFQLFPGEDEVGINYRFSYFVDLEHLSVLTNPNTYRYGQPVLSYSKFN